MPSKSKRVFWFHYNKPESRKLGKPQITIHHDKKCIVVDNVICNVTTHGRIRKNQPFWVLSGKTHEIFIENGVATIN